MVVHDADEEQSWRDRWSFGEPHIRSRSQFVRGTLCKVDIETAEIFSARSPAYNARGIKYMARCGEGDREARMAADPFIAEHAFTRLNPPAVAEDAEEHPVRKVYAQCEGCVARGYHLAHTDISCAAFGVIPPPPRPYNDIVHAEKLAKMTPEERAADDAEQARLKAQVLEHRVKFKPEMDRRREEWRRAHAAEME